MEDALLIKLLLKTPAPTGELLGKCLDAWAEWCKDFDEREEEELNRPKSEYEL